MFGDDRVQAGPTAPKDGGDIADLGGLRFVIAENEFYGAVCRNTELLKLLVIRRQLKQSGDAHMTRQLRVDYAVAAVGLLDEKVGVADEGQFGVGFIKEDTLENDRGTGEQSVTRARGVVAENSGVAARRLVEFDHRITELGAIAIAQPSLMHVSELGRPHQHRIISGQRIG